MYFSRGTWVAQLVKWPTPDFHLGHDLSFLGSSSTLGSRLSAESDCPSPSPNLRCLFLSKISIFIKKIKTTKYIIIIISKKVVLRRR